MIGKQRKSELTEGVIWKTLLVFILPILAGNFFQHLYTTADAVIIGRFTGKEGLAAIDSVFSLLKLPINLFSGLSAGSSILISQLYGAKKYDRVNTGIHTGLLMGITVIGILSTILYFWSIPLGTLFIGAEDYRVLATMERLMHLIAPFYTIFVFAEIFSAAMYGIGETLKPMIITLLGICVFRMLWIWCIVPYYPSIEVIVWAFPASWILSTCAFTVAYLRSPLFSTKEKIKTF